MTGGPSMDDWDGFDFFVQIPEHQAIIRIDSVN